MALYQHQHKPIRQNIKENFLKRQALVSQKSSCKRTVQIVVKYVRAFVLILAVAIAAGTTIHRGLICFSK